MSDHRVDWTWNLACLGAIAAARFLVNLPDTIGELQLMRVCWLYIVTLVGDFLSPGNLLIAAAIPLVAFTFLKYKTRDASFHSGIPLALMVLAFDVVIEVVAPPIGSGLRWTTPVLQQSASIALDALGGAVMSLVLVFGVANTLSSGLAKLLLRWRVVGS